MNTRYRQSAPSAFGRNSSQVEEVSANAGGLVKATLGAAAVAGAILTFIWLPAEYGVDPTGVGHLLGLTEMGHIKEQLHAEADADAAALAVDSQSAASPTAIPVTADITDRLDAMQAQLAAIALSVGAPQTAEALPTANETEAQSAAQAITAQTETNTSNASTSWRDQVDYTLAPGQGIEVKLAMQNGAIAEFAWTANGAVVNHDTHGDGDGQSISYEKGRSVPEQTGQLVAAFTGNHGWFWRNRTDDAVVLTLRTRGDYEKMLLP